jgi:hypothetical protein
MRIKKLNIIAGAVFGVYFTFWAFLWGTPEGLLLIVLATGISMGFIERIFKF